MIQALCFEIGKRTVAPHSDVEEEIIRSIFTKLPPRQAVYLCANA